MINQLQIDEYEFLQQTIDNLQNLNFYQDKKYLDYTINFSKFYNNYFSKEQKNENMKRIKEIYENNIRISKVSFKNLIKEHQIYYIERYGSSQLLINFYIKNNMFKEACQQVFQEKISTSIFIHEILVHCIKYDQIEELHKHINIIDPNFKKCWNYLNQSCKYLSENNYSECLYKFQIFMQDYGKATYRCLNMFAESGDKEQKMKYLEKAEEHCLQSLIQQPKIDFGKQRNDMREQMKSVKKLIQYQKIILQKYPEFNHMHLFSPVDKLIAFLCLLIKTDQELTFQIISHLKLLNIFLFQDLLFELSPYQEKFHQLLSIIYTFIRTHKFQTNIMQTFLYSLDLILFQILNQNYQSNNHQEDDKFYIQQIIQRINNYQVRLQAYILTEQFEKAIIICIENNNVLTLESLNKLINQKSVVISQLILNQMQQLIKTQSQSQ